MSSNTTDTGSPHETIVIASKNPVKIDAALQGLSSMFPASHFTTQGISVPSGVPDQPLTDDETLQGATNRVKRAREQLPDADYWVGLEGGLHPDGDSLQSFAWAVVMGKDGRMGKARTSTYYLPDEVARLVRGGMELGHADDLVFGQSNSKHRSGSVGLLTDDVVTRTSYYVQAVILALIPFKNAALSF